MHQKNSYNKARQHWTKNLGSAFILVHCAPVFTDTKKMRVSCSSNTHMNVKPQRQHEAYTLKKTRMMQNESWMNRKSTMAHRPIIHQACVALHYKRVKRDNISHTRSYNPTLREGYQQPKRLILACHGSAKTEFIISSSRQWPHHSFWCRSRQLYSHWFMRSQLQHEAYVPKRFARCRMNPRLVRNPQLYESKSSTTNAGLKANGVLRYEPHMIRFLHY